MLTPIHQNFNRNLINFQFFSLPFRNYHFISLPRVFPSLENDPKIESCIQIRKIMEEGGKGCEGEERTGKGREWNGEQKRKRKNTIMHERSRTHFLSTREMRSEKSMTKCRVISIHQHEKHRGWKNCEDQGEREWNHRVKEDSNKSEDRVIKISVLEKKRNFRIPFQATLTPRPRHSPAFVPKQLPKIRYG